MAEAEAAWAESRRTRSALLAETRRSLSDRLTKATQDLAQLQQQSAKAVHRQQITQLKSPVAGTVQQLAVRTTGGVVTAAQPLMVVVPDEAEITAEVSIDNKDIGFVRVGQEAAVKLEAFSFTRYGTVPAVVTRVSADAVVDEKKGTVFVAGVKLAHRAIGVDGATVALTPGMNVTAEVRTGGRAVIDFLLSPIQRQRGGRVGASGEWRMRLGEVNVSEEASPDRSELAMLLLRVAQKCAACTSSEDFAALVRNDVRPLLPHTSLIAVLGRIDLEHLELVHVEAVDYPAHALKTLQWVTNLRNRPVLARWLSSRVPIVLDAEVDEACMSESERGEGINVWLGQVAVHGVFDMGVRSGSYFSIGGLPRALDPQEVSRTLELLVPHLHQALTLCNQATASRRIRSVRLTEAEREIMRWVAAGRTNAEIAHLRGRSEATIRNQLTTTFRKLGVSNRAAAVRFQAEWA